jgi:hypothetical protein
MSEQQRSSVVARSILALFAGFVAIVILSEGTDFLLVKAGIFPRLNQPFAFTTQLLAIATLYRAIYSIAGCYLAARLAPKRPFGHALVLGGVGCVVGIAGAIVMRGKGPEWYPWTLVVLALPCGWLGGALHHNFKLTVRGIGTTES